MATDGESGRDRARARERERGEGWIIIRIEGIARGGEIY